MGFITGKINQEYSEDLAAIVMMKTGNHKKVLKAIWKYAKENGLVAKGRMPPINADARLKKLFGKDQVRPMQDFGILKKAGHIKQMV